MLLKTDGMESWTCLIGQHNAYNLLAIYTTAVVLGADPEETLVAMSSLRPAPGRLENMRGPKDISVIIDYAHTPDGFENVLSSVKGFCKGRTIAVFGCGGDRDPIKRPIMGEIGTRIADIAVITSDNPRTEDPEKIIADIIPGAEKAGKKFDVVVDRRQAIRYALSIAEKDDIIVLAGKGHETYQEINGVKHHLDEREEVAAALEEMKG